MKWFLTPFLPLFFPVLAIFMPLPSPRGGRSSRASAADSRQRNPALSQLVDAAAREVFRPGWNDQVGSGRGLTISLCCVTVPFTIARMSDYRQYFVASDASSLLGCQDKDRQAKA